MSARREVNWRPQSQENRYRQFIAGQLSAYAPVCLIVTPPA
jgi:hypothetical protein